MMKSTVSCTLSLLFLTILITLISFQVNGETKDIPNVESNKEVQEIGRDCIDQYNKKEVPRDPAKNLPLTFKQVVKASLETVLGFKKYTLKINSAFHNGTIVSIDFISAFYPDEKTGTCFLNVS
ncbi:hypothetical protein LIER_43150 [Lithospermum erythrorhizon]|uniref:Uncharacterized protein n=1 Tax=Lithospermum erythrorhizon TaxID=34254 RepID=A0AAV3PJ72_LITER